MSEKRKFCRICKNLGIDCETGMFYCSLSHRLDKLPNTLKCDEFILCDFITQLEQLKNKYYQQTLDDEIIFNELYQTLQEIKTIAEKELSYDMVGNEHRHYKNYDIIRHLITKVEEE